MRGQVEVTDRAIAALATSLANVGELEGRCYRLKLVDVGRFDFVIERPKESDLCFDWEGATVVAISIDLRETLTDRVLDLGEDGRWQLTAPDP